MHNQEMRDTVIEILNDVNSNTKPIKSYECLKLISDVLRFMLTLCVHEMLQDCRLLYTVMDSAQYIYYVGVKKRKSYLYELLSDHGIWADQQAWYDTIEFYLLSKIEDAVARKKRKEEIDKKSSNNFKALFSGQLIKGMLQKKENKKITDFKEH